MNALSPRATAAAFSARQACPDEFGVVMELLDDSISWLRGKGLDQWSGWRAWPTKMDPSLRRGDVWLLCDGNDLVGTVTVELAGDPDFWTEAELAEPAAYVSKLAVRRSHAGRELGSLLLDWASDHAFRHGCRWVRLDAWKTNPGLHDYYLDRGWTYLRTSSDPRRLSGALFQTAARPLPPASRALIREVPPVPILPTSGMSIFGAQQGETGPGHGHLCHGITIRAQHLGDTWALLLPTNRYRVIERAGQWVLEGQPVGASWWQRDGEIVATDLDLRPGATYVITHQPGTPCEMSIVDAAEAGDAAVVAAA
jgi:GNAT superfamily N-acetyltransferase